MTSCYCPWPGQWCASLSATKPAALMPCDAACRLASMWRQWSTRTSASLCGTWEARTRCARSYLYISASSPASRTTIYCPEAARPGSVPSLSCSFFNPLQPDTYLVAVSRQRVHKRQQSAGSGLPDPCLPSPFGMSLLLLTPYCVPGRFARCGGITSKIHRASSLLWTATIVIVLERREMSCIGC